MISRSALTWGAQRSLRWPILSACQLRRYATAVSGSASYEIADVNGLRVVSRDTHGPTTKLAIVAKAGTRYETAPGLTVGLEEYAFKNTYKRSALRIQREAELLGGQLSASHSREGLILEASFLRSDLPYFAELLGEVVSESRFSTHELHEEIELVLHMKQTTYTANAANLALDAVHAAAFHSGLGAPYYPCVSTAISSYLDEHNVAAFSYDVYSKATMALVADGANPTILSQWTEKFFSDVRAVPENKRQSPASKYFGGERRIPHAQKNAMVIAFSSDIAKPEFSVLAALLGGQSTISWSRGFTLLSNMGSPGYAEACNVKYSDAGLFIIKISGSPSHVKSAAEGAVNALKSVASSVSEEDVAKAIARAKFDAFEAEQDRPAAMLSAGLGAVNGNMANVAATVKALDVVTPDQIKAAAKALVDSKASVAAVGDLFVLPHATDLGLKV